MENLATIVRLVVDKTGTLTKGELELTGIEVSEPGREGELLGFAAALSGNSPHPLSRAIVAEHLKRGGEVAEAGQFESLAGKGLRGTVESTGVLLGRRSLFEGQEWIGTRPDPEPGMTEVLVTAGGWRGGCCCGMRRVWRRPRR